jgi:hypothetical protein
MPGKSGCMTPDPRRLAALFLSAALALAGCGGGDEPKKVAAPPEEPDRCPLTGVVVPEDADPDRATLVVKIDNVDDARPQAGLDQADLVVEETVEGGLTRLFAVFQCEAAPSVGPIRSGRTTDVGLLRLFDGAVFAYSGANKTVNRQLADAGAELLAYDNDPDPFRLTEQAAPHNVYSSTDELLDAGLGDDASVEAPEPLFTYTDSAPTSAKAAQRLALEWSGFASATWSWRDDRWVRTQNGTPDVLANDVRVSAANVLALRITTRDTGLKDVAGNSSPGDVVTGSGKLWLFRDGKVVTGTWKRDTLDDPMTLTADSGAEISLARGRTWLELLPPTATIRIR